MPSTLSGNLSRVEFFAKGCELIERLRRTPSNFGLCDSDLLAGDGYEAVRFAAAALSLVSASRATRRIAEASTGLILRAGPRDIPSVNPRNTVSGRLADTVDIDGAKGFSDDAGRGRAGVGDG
jgi:hypothetical protein